MKDFLAGLGLGIGLGMLFAPASGRETRERLAGQAQKKMGQVISIGREKAGEVGRDAGEKAFDKAAEKLAGEDAVRRSYEQQG